MGKKDKKRADNQSASRPTKGPVKGDAPRRAKQPHDAGSDPTPTGDEDSSRPVQKKGLHGVPGSKNDSRRCTATARRTGERCRAPAILGGNVCRVHGGAAKQTRAAAKARLLELVDPALAALHKVLTNPDTDDPVKVRAAVAILDRTGFGPNSTVHVQASKWDEVTEDLARNGFVEVDRSLDGGGGDAPALMANLEQHALDLTTDNFRDQHEEDAPVRIYADENTIRGEVIDPDPHPHDEEAWREAGRDPGATTRRVRRDG